MGEFCKVTTDRHDKKIRGNFANESIGLDQAAAVPEEGDDTRVTFYIHLVDLDKPEYMYKLPAQEKLDRVLHLKGIAARFFKLQQFKKAARIY
jgi:hypothetical protein